MMTRNVVMRALAVLGLAIAVTACGSDDTTDTPDSNDAVETQDTDDSHDDGTTNDGEGEQSTPAETTIPAGAVAAIESFPFPVPEDWIERIAFEEIEIGASEAMSATYEFSGDFTAAASMYRDMLNTAGFTSEDYPLGEMTNDASITVDGVINGVTYSGTVDFDTHADGYQRATIDLVVQ